MSSDQPCDICERTDVPTEPWGDGRICADCSTWQTDHAAGLDKDDE